MTAAAMPEFRVICKTSDVPEGSGRMFVVDERPVGVFHVDGKFYAMDNRCPHAGASLAHGLIENDTVTCRIHHWRFCIRDGKYLDQNQPELNASSLPLRLVGDAIQVDLGNVREIGNSIHRS